MINVLNFHFVIDKYPVAIQNSMYGSKLLINDNIIEIQEYKNRYNYLIR